MPETEPLPLVIRDLSFRYNSRSAPAIKNINLKLRPGEVLLLAGSSGCGKTTLMRCINGLIPEAYHGEMTGDILLYGESVRGKNLAEISQCVGTLLQDPERQILGTYVLNEVCFGLESLGLDRAEMIRRGEAALERLHILHLRDKETFGTSGGEKQKVALAGVLAMQPKILLLDEPLASLDPASAREALLAFRQLADEGLAVMIVEHRVEDVLAIHPERVVYMEDGEIVYEDEADGLTRVVDYHKIKLPAPAILERAKDEPEQDFVPAVPPLDLSKPLIQFQDVGFRYHEDLPEVLHGVNLSIHAGEVIAILGHNGSGKTTLVKHALGLLKPTRGSVLLEGTDSKSTTVAKAAKTVGYVFQSPTQMLFAPTVQDELAFGPKNLGFSKEITAENVRWAIQSVHLEEELATPPLALSFGQQKRVSIASVLSMRSRILMMDEPTAGQDYWNYQSFMDTILQMPGFDSIIFITHDLDLALTYANRIIMLYDGKIAADGLPQDVLKDSEQLLRWRLLPTSLLELNYRLLPRTGKFQRAEALARYIV
ncbi:MAG TPA: ABC transporter ATP-binding protein [Anaerolineaceae bacterium]|jgi:energy-coupling factor transport system ATP-binding protein|nr:ABC transporter ATP-binding protein [Anaerolineaceae bacterium]HOE34202.1 ABC transporter ATP-binding protein [Anaerolineaceae bacterium]HOT25199.1 ABC transporter ATP-binding protein [Anaerolineaceae bacterium]HQH57754.1 ABC transporter ATP-binding protein [Anaerolineaceae bacterium]HQK02740.1 ABC transporter ATP-binding protein [Anaerolineaceae bacterium]